MLIAGLQKTTLLDYPGKVAAIVFTYGCNFACSFCHNPELVLGDANNANILRIGRITEEGFFDFLKKRQGLLDGVCITGGEPTLHPDLPEFIKKIKDLGFLVKLDSNGTNPEMLRDLINKKLVDYIAMDIKISEFDNVKYIRSVEIVEDFMRNKDGEFRWTLYPGTIEFEKETDAVFYLFGMAKNLYLQKFSREMKLLNDNNSKAYTIKQLKDFEKEMKNKIKGCKVRW